MKKKKSYVETVLYREIQADVTEIAQILSGDAMQKALRSH